MSSDEEYLSELTDIDSDDYEESKSKSKKGKAKASTWKIRMSLKPPRATTYSAQALYDQIHGGDVNLEPPYQRDVVWPETKQIMVIDSIFRNFYIPPVIFSVQVHDDGSETKTCIDGKQRLTSIWKFMDGLVRGIVVFADPYANRPVVARSLVCRLRHPLSSLSTDNYIRGHIDKDAISGKKLFFKDNKSSGKGPKHELLPERYRKVFANKQIVCVEYHEISEDDEREVFQRVQLGMALTPAEKLQVISTPRAAFVRSILGEYLREDGALCPPHLNWKIDRGSDFRCLGHSIHIMEGSNTSARKVKTAQSDFKTLERWLGAKTDLSESFKTSVRESFEIFASIASSSIHGAVFKKNKTVAPLEFVFVGVLIFLHKDTATKKELTEGIASMFENVRDAHVDVRMNNKVMKTIINFINNWKPGGDKVSAGQKRKRPAAKGEQAKKKKKSDEEDDDMDVDHEPEEEDEDGEVNENALPPKAPPKSTLAKNSAKSGPTSTVARSKTKSSPTGASPPVKTEPESTIIPAAPAPTPKVDRLAGLRKAKEQIAQKEAERAAAAPVAPRALLGSLGSKSTASASSASAPPSSSTISTNPQMLPSPSPGQNFVVPSSLATSRNESTAPTANPSTQSASPVTHGPPNGPNATSTPTSSASTGVNKLKIPPIRIPPGGHPLPAPPLRSPDIRQDRRDSRDWEKDKDRGRDWSRERGRYDDRDRDRYDRGRGGKRGSGSGWR